ncbi:MAG: hypothetical protein R3191_05470, partial [Anaerolineales bacterium]|nr:hypothetical protein [Anaerolineales bacterium]
LEAVRDGRIQTLVVQTNSQSPGVRCGSCGFLTSHSPEECPYCGTVMEPVPDAVDLAIREVMRSGGDVEIVQGSPAFQESGGIGALLRY